MIISSMADQSILDFPNSSIQQIYALMHITSTEEMHCKSVAAWESVVNIMVNTYFFKIS